MNGKMIKLLLVGAVCVMLAIFCCTQAAMADDTAQNQPAAASEETVETDETPAPEATTEETPVGESLLETPTPQPTPEAMPRETMQPSLRRPSWIPLVCMMWIPTVVLAITIL